MQFTRPVTANFKQLIYAAVYSFMPIYAGGPRAIAARFVRLFHSSNRLFFEPLVGGFFASPLPRTRVQRVALRFVSFRFVRS